MNSCIVYLIVKSSLLKYMTLIGPELAQKKQAELTNIEIYVFWHGTDLQPAAHQNCVVQ